MREDPEPTRNNNIYGLDLPIYDKNGGYTWNWLPFLWQNGGEFLNDDRTEAMFNSPEGVEALEFWKKMVQEDKSVPLRQRRPASTALLPASLQWFSTARGA